MSNTSQYWKKRYDFVDSLGKRTEQEMLAHIKELYENIIFEIGKEIAAFYGRYAQNNIITLAEAKKHLNASELRSARYEIAKYYSSIDKLARTATGEVSTKLLRKYKEELRQQSARAYLSRLEDLKIRIKDYIVQLGVEEDAQLHKSLLQAGEYTYNRSADELSKYTGFTNAPSKRQFEKMINARWLGQNYSGRVWESKKILEQELETTFLQGMVRGQNPRKIAEDMQKDMGGDYHRFERLARTETMHILNEAVLQSYEDYGVQEYQFITGQDERTCEICGSLDGEHFKLSEKMEGINYPVMHPNCRCSTIPYFED